MSSAAPAPENDTVAGQPWWRERDVFFLLVLVVAAYFTRAGVLPIRGEEPTRAQIALEMVERGDWVVPRQQGEPFLIRPPLQNWLIAASCLTFGTWDVWAVRLPSLLATLLTTLLIYGYGRTFLSRLGALAAAAAFATFVDMFQMGRQAETEALFILLVSASLLLWHWGLVRRWPAALTFALGYALMALAMLTKGIQAPVYFIGSLSLFLVLTGQWRRLFSGAHLEGMLVGAAILLAWTIPYAQATGWSNVRLVWMGDPAVAHNAGVQNWHLRELAIHLVTYPLEIAAGTLPWSLLLLLFCYRDFRRSIQTARPQVLFLGICLAVAFPTCWIPPGGLPRFFAPLYPCLSVFFGLAVQYITATEAAPAVRAFWRWFLVLMAGVMAVAAVAVVGVTALAPHYSPLAPFAEAPLAALAYALAAVGLAIWVLRARNSAAPDQVRTVVLALAAFLVLTFTGVVTDFRLRRSEDAAEAMQRLKEKLPPGQQLVSINGHAPTLFAYHYGLPIIAPGPRVTPKKGSVEGLTYFCFFTSGNKRPQLPFAWEEVGVVPLDRNHLPVPENVVVVGCRLPQLNAPAAP
jgi:4-amino-4-deoxy-L-arabinose transferase-like glycosyltransferase